MGKFSSLTAVVLVGGLAGQLWGAPSMVRLAHLSPDAPPVDICVDGERVLSDVPYRTVSDYLKLGAGDHTVQVGAFKNKHNAYCLRDQLDRRYKYAHIAPGRDHDNGDPLYRVLVGKCNNLQEARRYEKIMHNNGFENAFIVAE